MVSDRDSGRRLAGMHAYIRSRFNQELYKIAIYRLGHASTNPAHFMPTWTTVPRVVSKTQRFATWVVFFCTDAGAGFATRKVFKNAQCPNVSGRTGQRRTRARA